MGRTFRGRCPRLLYGSPAGIKDGQFPRSRARIIANRGCQVYCSLQEVLKRKLRMRFSSARHCVVRATHGDLNRLRPWRQHETPTRVAHTLPCMYAADGEGCRPAGQRNCGDSSAPRERGPQNDTVRATHEGRTYFTVLNRFSISAQFTTFHQAAMYSARRFWYLR